MFSRLERLAISHLAYTNRLVLLYLIMVITNHYIGKQTTYTKDQLFAIRNTVSRQLLDNVTRGLIQNLHIKKWTFRGCRAGRNIRRHIRTIVTSRDNNVVDSTCISGVNKRNLSRIKCDYVEHPSATRSLTICCLNPRSIKNKTLSLSDFIVTNDYDIVALTETWLGTSVDKKCIGDLVPSGYKFRHIPRPTGKTGGGVALLYKSGMSFRLLSSSKDGEYTHFEHMDCVITTCDTSVRLAVVYRPPSSKQNGFKNSEFFNQWSLFLSDYATHDKEVLIVGDLNFHVDADDDTDAQHFMDTISTCGLQQHVHESTHVMGHTLDVVISRETSSIVSKVVVTDPGLCDHLGKLTRDHFAVGFTTTLTKPAPVQKTVSFRRLRAIDVEAFKQDIKSSYVLSPTEGTVDSLVDAYNEGLKVLIDKHAPARVKTIIQRPNCPWYTDELHEAKHTRRQLERKWQKSRLTVHHQIYRHQCVVVNKLIKQARTTYYSDKISVCGHDQKGIYNIANHLLGERGTQPLPETTSDTELAETFSTFFTEKIVRIRESLGECNNCSAATTDTPEHDILLTSFGSVSIEEVKKLIMKSPDKSCDLDPVPTWLLKQCINELLPLITAIVNVSFRDDRVPDAFKCAQIKPLLKKAGLDPNTLKNYRPVSNLPFLSKVLEKAVDTRIEQHLVSNHLHEEHQSAYRKSHSTETALLKVQNDILESLDNCCVTVLIMLDLSAAFDTLDHNTLLHRFEHDFGITDHALKWTKSYLSERYQLIVINGACSKPVLLQYGVPQGSVLGPKKYTMYSKPLGDIIRRYGLLYHFYADDTQLYVSFKPQNELAKSNALTLVEHCLTDIEKWMNENMLKLNSDKTEVMLFTSKHNAKHMNSVVVRVGDTEIASVSSVKNLGVIFDSAMNMEKHVKNVCRSAYFQLRNIGHIRRYLTRNATKSLVNGLVTSRLDYCNSLLSGLPQKTLHKLQVVQNTAARIVTRTPRYSHITPVLKELHWLPVERRVQFKILMHTYKALHGQAPEYIGNMLKIYTPGRTLRSSETLHLVATRAKTVSYGERQFKFSSAKLWNELPCHIRDASTLDNFKQLLKTHLFSLQYFSK